MVKRICGILWIAVIALLLIRLPISAHEKSNLYQIQITHDASGLHIAPCPLPGISGDTWRFFNSTSDTLYLIIPMCVGKQYFPLYFLAAGDSIDHTVDIWDAQVRVILLRTGEFAQCDREHPPACPILTQGELSR